MTTTYIITSSGVQFYPLSPTPGTVRIQDIAHHLSRLCRFTGACFYPYSVAEHSLRCAEEARKLTDDPMVHLQALMHDAAEAYMSDIPKPVKMQFPAICETEDRLLACIFEKYQIDYPLHPLVKEIDKRMFLTEVRDLMPGKDYGPWYEGYEPFDLPVRPWNSCELVSLEFLSLFFELRNILHTR